MVGVESLDVNTFAQSRIQYFALSVRGERSPLTHMACKALN